MKKLIATVLIAMIAFTAFAGFNVTIDTIMQYANQDKTTTDNPVPAGFSIGGADESWFADMNATLSGSRGSALLNIRFNIPNEKYKGAAVEVHAWEVKAKVTDWLKISVGNTAYELSAEPISWEPVFGAGLFEQGKNRVYLDMSFDYLEIIAGMSMGQDQKKPWNTASIMAIYDVSSSFRLSAEFSFVPNELCLSMFNDGEVKTVSFQADYFGIENLELVGGYSFIFAKGDGLVEHRGDLLATYYAEKYSVEFYDAILFRRYAGEGIGNRLALQFKYYATDELTPFVKFNWFKNYGYAATNGGFAWGECQLAGPGTDKSLIILDAGVGFVLTENISGSIGAQIKKAKGVDLFWSIPLCLTAMF